VVDEPDDSRRQAHPESCLVIVSKWVLHRYRLLSIPAGFFPVHASVVARPSHSGSGDHPCLYHAFIMCSFS